jgi:hypothetical protein
VRPEKIRLATPETVAGPDEVGVIGRVRDAVYLGVYTRYLVELELGIDLTVIEQNSSIHGGQAVPGRMVQAIWPRAANQAMAGVVRPDPAPVLTGREPAAQGEPA